jgi:hypothetical protein
VWPIAAGLVHGPPDGAHARFATCASCLFWLPNDRCHLAAAAASASKFALCGGRSYVSRQVLDDIAAAVAYRARCDDCGGLFDMRLEGNLNSFGDYCGRCFPYRCKGCGEHENNCQCRKREAY